MSKEIKLSASKRESSGSTAAKALRKTGAMPAVVYGEKGARSIKINTREFETVLKTHTSENLIVDLSVEGEVIKALLREVQHEAVMGGMIHADFLEISMTKKMRVTIQVTLKGEPVGVSQQGGILEHLLRHVEVECLPGDLVESFDVDVTGMALGKTMMIRDLVLDPKFTVLTAGDVAVATVVAPREEKVEEVVAAAEAAPEVISKKKEGEAAAEGAAPAKDGAKKEDKKEEKKPAAKK
ncbi:MAG: 50S ribosomal protein L25 [bacterium]